MSIMKSRIVLYCALGGLPMVIAALGAGHFAWWWLSGIVLAAAFVPVALFGPRSALGQFGVIAPVLVIITALCTWSEALIFVPGYQQHAARDLTGSLVMYLFFAAVLTLLAWGLKLTKPPDHAVEHRSPASAIGLVAVCGVAYVVYYLIFGAITYQFFTKGYYPEAEKIAVNLGIWFWAIQFARGVLMTVAVVPIIYALRMNRWQVAIAVGVLIWVAGGLAPLLVPNVFMGATQRMIHIVEILTQNASLGITAGLLLRPKPAARAASSPESRELLRHAS
jgi:hypothetical protein